MRTFLGKTIAGLATSLFALGALGTAQAMEVGVAWQGKSGMAKRVLAGFEEGMKEVGAGANLEVRPELSDRAALDQAISDFEASKGAMVILRSNGAKALGDRSPAIPAFVGGTNHPGHLGVVSNLDAPEGNISGVTYFIEYTVRLESFASILPEVSSLHLVVEEGHPGSQVDIDGTMAACSALGLTCSHSTVKGREAILADVSAHKDVSAIVIGNQAGLYDEHMSDVLSAAGETPVVSYAASAVKNGALTALSANDHELGRMLAVQVVEVLSQGKSVSEVPIGFDQEPRILVNMSTLSSLGIELAPEIFESAQLIE